MSTERSELRPLCQVQLAHDALVGILLEPKLCPPEGPERNALIGAADVLCWVLQHDHNKTFDANLRGYLAYAADRGFAFGKDQTMSASHSEPMGARGWEPDFDHTRDLERMVKISLDEKGPLPFGDLLLEVRGCLSIQASTLHDQLNNMIAAGLLQITPKGFYLVP